MVIDAATGQPLRWAVAWSQEKMVGHGPSKMLSPSKWCSPPCAPDEEPRSRPPASFRVGTLLALVIFFGSLQSFAQDVDARRARALASFDAVLRANREATGRTRDDLEAVLAARPDDALARVHFGWLLVLAAREKPMLEARAAAEKGFREMDAAVIAAPEDPAVRLVRARSDAQMPLMLGRGAVAEADFAWLVAGARTPPRPEAWPANLRREVFFQAGALALKLRRAAEAVPLLEEAASLPATLPSDDDVQSMLALACRELSSQSHAEDPPPHQAPAAAP